MKLESWGWSAEWRSRIPESAGPGQFPGRVVFSSRGMHRVVAERGENWAVVKGALRHSLTGTQAFPVVGDWVLLRAEPQSDTWLLSHILPRRSAFSRNNAGMTTEEQIIASNCDCVFAVCGLDGGRNFSLRGLERVLTCTWNSGAVPVIVLNKTDLCDDVEGARLQAESIAPGVDVRCVSCVTGSGFDDLSPYLGTGRTVALIGRSGVGKSSIINRLAGTEVLRTGEIRDQDHRGRHTTTHRELVKLPAGGLLLDTPGLRELQLWGEETSLQDAFSDIEELGRQCRFRDCRHAGEPGCAVQEALADGRLDHGRFESYLDLQSELRFLKKRQDIRARLEEKRRQKSFGRRRKKLKYRTG